MDYERLLRRLRAHPALFGDDERKAEQIGRLIDTAKRLASPKWQERQDALKARADERLAFRWS